LLRKTPHVLSRAFDTVVDAGALAATELIGAMALTIGLEVLMRRVFWNSLPWVIQVNEYFVLSIPFLGGAWLLRQDGHTRLTLVLEQVSPRTAVLMNIATSILAAGICGVLFWATGGRVLEGIEAGTVIRGDGFNIREVWVWWVMPVGFTLLGTQFLRDAYSGSQRLVHMRNGADLPSTPPELFEV
jgi:C4-dicarboxylate transporter DctQ subunit